jgi:hypothetical protein
MKIPLSCPGLILLCIYILINALFVFKYSPDYSLDPAVTIPAYLIFCGCLISAVYGFYTLNLDHKTQRLLYFGLATAGAAGLAILMFQFDPERIAVGRYPALHDWIERLIHGEFPYLSGIRPSGFPFLFMISMPFYFIGDLGLLQIFSFAIFCCLIYSYYRRNPRSRIWILILLLSAPVFTYEVVVRSELFSNMVIVLVYLEFARKRIDTERILRLILIGLMGGLLLSTRGIVVLIYIIFFGYHFRKRLSRGFAFALSILAGFLATLVPFMIWNWDHFVSSGPFSIQMLYIPTWLLVLCLLASAAVAAVVKSIRCSYLSISLILFAVVLTVFTISAVKYGWAEAVYGDGFDISYFIFALPFLLLSMFPRENEPAPQHSFS